MTKRRTHKYFTFYCRSIFLLLAGIILPGIVLEVNGQSTEEKIAMLSSALHAREQGDLLTAKTKLEELSRISPDDVSIHRLLNSVNKELDKRGKKAKPSKSFETPEQVDWAENSGASSMSNGPDVFSSTNSLDGAQLIDLDSLILEAENSQELEVSSLKDNLKSAKKLADISAFDDALSLLEESLGNAGESEQVRNVVKDLQDLKYDILLRKAGHLLENNDIEGAEFLLEDYVLNVGSDRQSKRLERKIRSVKRDPERMNIKSVSAEFIKRQEELDEQIAIGRAQFNHGDFDGALDTFVRIEARDPSNTEAKYFQSRIAEIKEHRASLNHMQTRNVFLQNVRETWALPKIFDRDGPEPVVVETGAIEKKLRGIIIPEVNFRGLALSRVVETLHAYSVVHDPAGEGVNIIPMSLDGVDPTVNITLRNLSLGRVLDFVVQSVGYDYDIKKDSVIVTPGEHDSGIRLETEFFAVSRAAIIRMTNEPDNFDRGETASNPFEDDPAPASSGRSNTEDALIDFFERAGVSFAQVPGAKLALTDAQIIVTQTSRNLKKIGNILKKFSEIKMVEIEAKFLEVQQGDLEEFGVDWNIAGGEFTFGSQNRTVASAFAPSVDNNNIVVATAAQPAVLDAFGHPVSPGVPATETLIPSIAPPVPGQINTGPSQGRRLTFGDGETRALGPADVGIFSGQIGKYEVQAIIRALSQKTGNDLMTAPKVTVLSTKTAEIVVAQELIYPESYGDIEAEVSRGGRSSTSLIGSASSSIAITAGTPQDFTMRNVGVEMEVTPTVEEDYSISMLLEPKVTEFDGFVEYGGPSVAISGTITVTVPSGFYQPIFSVRRVRTEVTIWDGATILLGGLTREQIFSVSDKVPVLGDIPFIGRLFSSQGEGSQKRNLLIFVTANLVSPGGSPARQNLRKVKAGTIYNNATIVTPGGIVTRSSGSAGAE